MRLWNHWRIWQLFVCIILFHLSIVLAKNQSVILVNIDKRPLKLVYQTWVRPDLNEEGEWQSYDGTLNCIDQDATDAIIVESSDEQLPANFFNRYPDIESIHMTHKHLESIGSSDLLNANSLLRLNVSHNVIDRIAAYAFEPAPKLTEIDLSFNLLCDLNENIFTSYLIKYLYLHNNQLTVVNPQWFENLLYLRVLTLNNNRIQAIDWQLLDFLPNINALHLHSNKIADVQNDQQTPRSMQTFSLYDNPMAVASQHLIWLDAVVVDVRNTSAQICRIGRHMHTLIAANNEIREINLDNLSGPDQNSLVTLNLANNRLACVQNLTYFHRLQYLNLSQNLLAHIDSQLFDALNDLQRLDLSHNILKRFDVQNNQMMPNLKMLDVSFNEILTLDLAGILSQLENLNIDGNGIEITESLMKKTHNINHVSEQCLAGSAECVSDEMHQRTKRNHEVPSKKPQISDDTRDFIYEQFQYMEKNILELINAKFADITRRIGRLEQEMVDITTNMMPVNDWD